MSWFTSLIPAQYATSANANFPRPPAKRGSPRGVFFGAASLRSIQRGTGNAPEERGVQEYRGFARGARVDVDRQLTSRDRSSVESRESERGAIHCSPPTALPRSKLGAHDEGLHRRGLWEARNLHGAARAGSGLCGGRRVPRAQRGEARCLQGAHYCHSGSDERPRGHQARRSRVRRGARRACPDGRPPVRVGNGPGGSRLRGSGGALGLLVRVAHHSRRPGRLLVEDQSARERRRPARAPRSRRGPRRPGRGVPAGVCKRHAVDRRARERPRGGREPRPASVEPARGRSHSRAT